MRTRVLALAPLLAAVAVVAGCGGGGGGSSAATFAKDDLAKLVLKPSEAPKGLDYTHDVSGPGALEKANGEAALGALRKYGLEGDYVSEFLSLGKPGGPTFAESIALVFHDRDGASKAVAFSKKQASSGGRTQPISAAGLGDESWGRRGRFFNPSSPASYFYTWRIDNAVQSLVLSGTVTERQARSLADRLERRAREAA